MMWRPEAIHWLAKAFEYLDENEQALRYYLMAYQQFPDYKPLGKAMVCRDIGTFLSAHYVSNYGVSWIEEALRLHDLDHRTTPPPQSPDKNKWDREKRRWKDKAERQRRITETRLWHIRLLSDGTDEEARESLVAHALAECRDCSMRDQFEIVSFALEFADLVDRPRLEMRKAELCVRRRDLPGLITSTAKLVVDCEIYVLVQAKRFLI